MIERTEERFDLKPAYLAADTAYGSAGTLSWVVNEKKIALHIPVIDKSNSEDGTLSRVDFSFDKDRDVCICPNGKLLHTTGTIYDGNTLRYRASKLDCDVCAFKMRCCPQTAEARRLALQPIRRQAASLAGSSWRATFRRSLSC